MAHSRRTTNARLGDASRLLRAMPQLEELRLAGSCDHLGDLSSDHLTLAASVTARLRALLLGACDLTDAEDALLEVVERLPGVILTLNHDSPNLAAKGVRFALHRGHAWAMLEADRAAR